MAIIDRSEWRDLDGAILDAVDTLVVTEIAKRQRFAVDHYDTDGVTIVPAIDQVTAALADMSAEQNKMIRGLLAYLDDTGNDTFYKAGGTDGVNFNPIRDANSAEVDICRIVFNRFEPWTGGVNTVFFA